MIGTQTTDQPPTIEEHIERLLAFEPATFPVLSVYLNTQADQHGRTPELVPYLRREFGRLSVTWDANSPERESFDCDVQKILTYVDEQLQAATNGLAIFACAEVGDFFEAIQLNAPIEEHRIYAYNQPHLFHLTRIDDEYPRYATVITDANTARIFVFGLGQTLGTEEVQGEKVNRVKVGGWSQARYQRRVGNAHKQHARELVEQLGRIVAEDQVAHILIAGDSAMAPLLLQEMPKNLSEKVVDTLKLAVKASEQDLFTATLERMRELDAKNDAEKVDRLFQEYRARGLAVVGPQATLEALANGQVDELLISGALETESAETEPVKAILVPEIPDEGGGTESDSPRMASMPDLLVTKAKQTDAGISFIQDATLLAPVKGVGAFLRWRS